jgi:hypothetical protein
VPLARGSTATAGAEAGSGQVVLAPGGRPAGQTLVSVDPASIPSLPSLEVNR